MNTLVRITTTFTLLASLSACVSNEKIIYLQNLEDGVWIGAKSVVCPGVVCKSHSVLAVSWVASKDLEAYFIYQGNPAMKLRTRIIS